MGEQTGIEWTDHTFNPWMGCTRVSEGCENCYAESFAPRVKVKWGPKAERRLFPEKHWQLPLAWNKKAQKATRRARVFCASFADVFEARPELHAERKKLWELITITPWLDWQLLTKRPENIIKMVPAEWLVGNMPGDGEWPSNVWVGTTAENQQRLDERIEHLAKVPAQIRFLSCEPLLEQLDLGLERNLPSQRMLRWYKPTRFFLQWVIVGGESGRKARPFEIAWARSVVEQCQRGGVPVFVKQLGAAPRSADQGGSPAACEQEVFHLSLSDSHGGDPEEWPEDLRVREFPEVAA